jgi:hypothetical protein
LPSVTDALKKLFAANILRELTEDVFRAREAIVRDRENLEKFLQANLSIPIGFGLFGLSPKVKFVYGLRLKELGYVSPSFTLPSERPHDTVERIAIHATITAREQVESTPTRTPSDDIARWRSGTHS